MIKKWTGNGKIAFYINSNLFLDKLKMVPAADIFDMVMLLKPSPAEKKPLSRYFPLVDKGRQYKWTTEKKKKNGNNQVRYRQ